MWRANVFADENDGSSSNDDDEVLPTAKWKHTYSSGRRWKVLKSDQAKLVQCVKDINPDELLTTERCESTFTVTGFHNWKHAMGQKDIITSHDKCDVHKQAMIDWKQYKINMQHHTSVQDRTNSVCSQQIRHNRHYIKQLQKYCICVQCKIWPYGDIGKERIPRTLETSWKFFNSLVITIQ